MFVRVDNREFSLKVNGLQVALEHNPAGMPKGLTTIGLRRYYDHMRLPLPAALTPAIEFALALPPGRYIDVTFTIPGTQDTVHVVHNDHSDYRDPIDQITECDPYMDAEFIVH